MRTLFVVLISSAAGTGCSRGRYRAPEAGPMAEPDAASPDAGSSGPDAGRRLDAGAPIDAGPDPLNVSPTCTSGTMWTFGDLRSDRMNPGLACIGCHATHARAPRFSAAGTVYPSGHEPDRCNGASGGAIVVEIHDSAGHVAMLSPNSAGNFLYGSPLTPPLRSSVHYAGRTRSMINPAPSGDCNSCHTQTGTSGAPGRITLP